MHSELQRCRYSRYGGHLASPPRRFLESALRRRERVATSTRECQALTRECGRVDESVSGFDERVWPKTVCSPMPSPDAMACLHACLYTCLHTRMRSSVPVPSKPNRRQTVVLPSNVATTSYQRMSARRWPVDVTTPTPGHVCAHAYAHVRMHVDAHVWVHRQRDGRPFDDLGDVRYIRLYLDV